jgi:hypothetical protein
MSEAHTHTHISLHSPVDPVMASDAYAHTQGDTLTPLHTQNDTCPLTEQGLAMLENGVFLYNTAV